MLKKLAWVFIIIGILLFLFSIFLVVQKNNPNNLAINIEEVAIHSNNSPNDYPGLIIIPSLGILLPILPAQKNGFNWQTTDRGVSYLTSTPLPGEKGNSVLYGHNWASLLGSLVKIKADDQIIIKLNNGQQKIFKVDSIKEVYPDQPKILEQTIDSRITVYTCSGLFDQKRFIVSAVNTN